MLGGHALRAERVSPVFVVANGALQETELNNQPYIEQRHYPEQEKPSAPVTVMAPFYADSDGWVEGNQSEHQ